MHSSPSRVTAQSGYFVIADLSGYTRFVSILCTRVTSGPTN